MELDWETLLSEKRLIRTANGELTHYQRPEEAPRTPAEADVQRIIFSSPFRRLAGKTQVHPFAHVDYVHNRLTHSLEVAETGHGLAQRVMRELDLPQSFQRAAALHVRAACLGHDIGNPPYGHVGEAVIRDWSCARENDLRAFLCRNSASEATTNAIIRDLQSFDGNAQTFRLLSHPMPREGAHFRLTCATLGALIKYPYPSLETTNNKYSVFFTAQEEFDAVQRVLGLQPGIRHPLSYILEIADDMCYCITDCEDALLMNILEPEVVRAWFLELFPDKDKVANYKDLSISHLRAKVIHTLLSAFSEELITAFRDATVLVEFEKTSPTWTRLKRLKQRYQVVFNDEQKLKKEAQIRQDLLRTLDRFFEALLASERVARTPAEEALLQATFGETLTTLPHPATPGEKIHLLLDVITGMSDVSLQQFIRTH